MSNATARFTIEAGRMVAGQIQRSLNQYAFVKGLDLNIKKEMGLFDGVLMVTVKGDKEKVEWFVNVVQKWLKEMA